MSKEKPQEDLKEVNYYRIENSIKNLSGQILTIIDASISDKQQNKAIKDLIKHRVCERLFEWQDFYWKTKDGVAIKGHSINLDDLSN